MIGFPNGARRNSSWMLSMISFVFPLPDLPTKNSAPKLEDPSLFISIYFIECWRKWPIWSIGKNGLFTYKKLIISAHLSLPNIYFYRSPIPKNELNPLYYSYYPYPVPYGEDPVLIRNLQKAINGEFSAIQCYRKLAELAHSDEVRKQIEEIRRDEIRHLREFSTLYGSITGKHIMPKQTEECPDNFTRGLDAAFKDEQETVDFYLRAAEETSKLKAKGVFTRAARDEQNHAVWFLYYLMER